MNNLIYNARMALRDIMEVNIFTQGNEKVHLTVFPDLVWEGTAETRTDEVVQEVIRRLHDMDMDIADGETGVRTLMEGRSVEIVRKAA
ncbi:hypothetical protein AAH978_19125 [Streptomyces sp. ZYX-F-203]